jgi:chromosomal replication initiation ATPase DnaA
MLAVYGPSGSGKTHLAHVWCRLASAPLVEGERLGDPAELVAAANGRVALDNADRARDPLRLLHLMNILRDGRGSLLLLAQDPPARWPFHLPDLVSRLRAVPTVAIEPPDDSLLGAVIAKQFADRGVSVSVDVIAYLITRIERSYAAAQSCVTWLDQRALGQGRAITLPFVAEAIGERPRFGP